MGRYKVRYVGDDSLEHTAVVSARDHNDAKAKMKAKGVDFVVDVSPASNSHFVAVLVIVLVFVAVLLLLAR